MTLSQRFVLCGVATQLHNSQRDCVCVLVNADPQNS